MELPNDPRSFFKMCLQLIISVNILLFFLSAYNNLIHDCAADGPTVQYTEEMKELQKNSQLQKRRRVK